MILTASNQILTTFNHFLTIIFMQEAREVSHFIQKRSEIKKIVNEKKLTFQYSVQSRAELVCRTHCAFRV